MVLVMNPGSIIECNLYVFSFQKIGWLFILLIWRPAYVVTVSLQAFIVSEIQSIFMMFHILCNKNIEMKMVNGTTILDTK